MMYFVKVSLFVGGIRYGVMSFEVSLETIGHWVAISF